MGQLDGFNRNSIKDFLVEISNIQGRMIFNIDVKNSFSFFETENKYMDQFLALNKAGIEFNARPISFEVSKAKPSGGGYGEKRSYGGGSREDGRRGERRSFGGSREGGERRSYGGGEKRSYSGGGERRSSFGGNREGGERKSYGSGEKRSFDRAGNEKTFSGNREGGERRKRFSK